MAGDCGRFFSKVMARVTRTTMSNVLPVVAVAMISVIGTTGCREPVQPVNPSVTTMIVQPRDVRFDVETFRELVPVSMPDLVAGGVDGWIARNGDPVIFSGERIEVAGGRDFVSLISKVAWEAAGVDAIEFEISNLTRSARGLRVYWAGPNGDFSESRMSRAVGLGDERSIVQLAGHSGWTGGISRIRLDIPCPAGGETIVRSIRPVRFEYDHDGIASAAESFWKVELDDDLRNAGLVTAQLPLVWTFEDPRAGVLEFSYGGLATVGDDLQLGVAVRNLGGEWFPVYEVDRLDEPNGSDSTWREARLDLTDHSPILAVRFTLSHRNESVRFAGLGVIANPALIPSKRRASPANVVLISLDTLRADRLASYGYDRVTSPLLDARAARSGVLFRNTVAPSPRTLPSHTTMMTGLDCVTHGVNHHSPAPGTLQTLAEVLRGHGYRTMATVGGGLLNPNFGLAQGFDEYYHYAGWAGGFEELEVELGKALEKLNRGKGRPFFLFFHTYEIHDPYHKRAPFTDGCFSDSTEPQSGDLIYGAIPRSRTPEEGYSLSFDLKKWIKGQPVSSAELVPKGELTLVNCLYDSAISYADLQMERLLNRLDELGVLDDTLVVVTADHGESLGEKGLFKHAYLYENNLMVPLIVFLPNGRHGGSVVDRQVGSVDIFPTILDALGIEAPADVDGRSLMPLIRGEDDPNPTSGVWSYAAYENRGLSLRIDNQVKFIFNNSANPWITDVEELYRLSNDAEELENLASVDPETSGRLKQRLASYYRAKTTAAKLEVENTGCDVVRGTIGTGSLFTHLKSVDAVSGRVHDVSDHRAGINIVKGDSLQVFVESSEKMEIDLEAVGCGLDGSAARLRRSIALEDGGVGLFLGLTESGWQAFEDGESLASSERAAQLTLGGPGRVQQSGGDPLDEDAVLEQLRSLGYVQ